MSPITTTSEDTINAPLPELDTNLPNPTQGFSPTNVGQPTYGQFGNDYTGTQAGVVGAYRNYLGRDPESDAVIQGWAQNPNWDQGIRESYEAQTLGRARNEINPTINSQQLLQKQLAEQAYQQAQAKLGGLNPLYQGQLNELQFGLQGQQTGINTALQRLQDEYGINAQRLQDQYEPARIAALNAANRSGLLNSTIALDRLNQGFAPISRGLGDLARNTQTSQADLESKRQDLIQKYLLSRENLVSKRTTEAQAIQEAYLLALQQAQQQAAQLESTRTGSIYARGGELDDQRDQYQLQLQALQEQIRFQQEQSRLSRDQFEFGKSKA